MSDVLAGVVGTLIVLAIGGGVLAIRDILASRQEWSDVRDDAEMRALLVRWDERKREEAP